MTGYGRQVVGPTMGQPIMVSFDGDPDWKAGGITIDWSTVAAVGSDTTLPDGAVIPNGQKGLQFGTVLAKITASGKYGPAATNAGGATAATDGRQTLVAGECCVLNQTVLQSAPGLLFTGATDNPAVLVGGRVWRDRLQVGGTGQPTFAQLLAALPRLLPVEV